MLSTTVAKLYSYMKCLGSCQFLRGSWMDLSDEVANTHMRTDAKKLVTNMISMLRKEACSRSICDLAHFPTQNCSVDYCWMLTSTLILEHVWNTRPSYLLVQNIFAHMGERSFLSKHSQDFSCTTSTGKIFSSDVYGDSS